MHGVQDKRLAELADEAVKAEGFYIKTPNTRSAGSGASAAEARLQDQLRITRALKERRTTSERWRTYGQGLLVAHTDLELEIKYKSACTSKL